ncbi:MAG: Ribose operon repressor [Lentisphaerae bacterium ADurb.Bin242]|nr:MAG: Ribose operon repressor [Lentisphaerae bacterium ADurb.Bin242]
MISMKEIANRAGVSRTTVSFVLNGRYKQDMKISDEVATRVLATADSLGYVKNELVQSVVTGKSRVIAVISEFHEIMMSVVKGCVEEAAKYGYLVELIPLEEDINKALMTAVKYRAEGIFACDLPDKMMDEVDPKFFTFGIPSIGLKHNTGRMSFNQMKSAMLAAEHLVGLGHRKIICFGMDGSIAQQRAEGYRRVMAEHRLEPVVFQPEPPGSLKELEEAVARIIKARPDAVFCVNDPLAMHLLNRLYKRRLFVPDTFSVAGFGNVSMSELASPPLTTVSEPYYETGRCVFQRILNLIKTGSESAPEPFIGKLILRESTAKNTKYGGKK